MMANAIFMTINACVGGYFLHRYVDEPHNWQWLLVSITWLLWAFTYAITIGMSRIDFELVQETVGVTV